MEPNYTFSTFLHFNLWSRFLQLGQARTRWHHQVCRLLLVSGEYWMIVHPQTTNTCSHNRHRIDPSASEWAENKINVQTSAEHLSYDPWEAHQILCRNQEHNPDYHNWYDRHFRSNFSTQDAKLSELHLVKLGETERNDKDAPQPSSKI